jgi:hypothetical protein
VRSETLHSAALQVQIASSVAMVLQAQVVVRLVHLRHISNDCQSMRLAIVSVCLQSVEVQTVWSDSVTRVLRGGGDGGNIRNCSVSSCYLSVEVQWQAEDAGASWWQEHLQALGYVPETEAPAHHVHTASAQAWFDDFKRLDMALKHGDTPQMHGWEMWAQNAICFQLSPPADVPAMPLVVLEVDGFSGRFTDNLINLDSCHMRRVCFLHDGVQRPPGVDTFNITTLRAALSAMSLSNVLPV